jgi:hypothetical protein
MLDSDAINAGLECGSVFSTQVARAKVKVAGVLSPEGHCGQHR